MITFTLSSPGASEAAGSTSFEIDIESDNFTEDTPDSFALEINGITIDDFETTGSDGEWAIQVTKLIYGPQSVRIKITATDSDETKSEIWTTVIDSERALPPSEIARKAFFLDSLIRYFPSYTKARSNKYSIYQQIINVLGLELDRVKESMHQQARALDLTRTIADDPDWLYQCQLDAGESFSKVISSSGKEEFEAPIVYGITGVNRLLLEGKSLFLDFWDRALPHRFTCIEEDIKNIQLTSSLPLSELSTQEEIDVPIPGHLYLWVHSISEALETTPDVVAGTLHITGIGANNVNQTEDIVVIRNGIQPTKKAWKKITRLVASGPTENFSGEIVIYNFPPASLTQNEPIFLLGGTEPLRWSLGSSEAGSYLDLTVSGPGYILDAVSGEDQHFQLQKYWLLDTDLEYVSIDSFSVDPTSYRVYGVNDETLYIWDRREPVASNLIELNGSVETPEIDFFVEDSQSFIVAEGTPLSTVRVELDTPRGDRGIDSWAWSIIHPNGDRWYRDISGDFTLTAPFYLFNTKPLGRYGIAQSNFTVNLSGVGTWIFELTVNFMDGTSEVVRHPYEVIGQVPIAQYKIDHLIDEEYPNVVTCLEDGRVVVTNSGKVFWLTPMYDSFMIDFPTETLSFREPFDLVELKND